MTPAERIQELIRSPLQACKPMTPEEWQHALRRERGNMQNRHFTRPTWDRFKKIDRPPTRIKFRSLMRLLTKVSFRRGTPRRAAS